MFVFESVREFDSREVFLLYDKWLGVALQNGVKDLVFRVPGFSYHFPIFKVLASKSLRKLVPRGSDLTRFSLSSSLANCDSLRKLSLSYVRLDEQMLQALLTSCPLIINLTLEHIN
ncbi:hypothetical protein A4A49_54906 [Nicotiana attenuata]|uniref:F-box/LRR-repeat protein 15/At3g58940/PEG3-like LRR domain-containing protein n=1 Tax=Nicotiana attenuata TaxID=49451 RepID=A0A1J6I400_NICAT|nr:hypothetical protein A4A49_54906 [Nicotiana attenuata]